jgi:hypothetical protein
LLSRQGISKDEDMTSFSLLCLARLTILALTSRGGMIMPFWTKFWVIVPPIVLLAITIIFYIVSGKKREG